MDLIRAVAIFLVVFLHVTNTFYNQIYLGQITDGSWWIFTIYKSAALPCVPLFVILSGSLLLQRSKLNEPIKVFLKKRLNRIGLAFAFWSAIYLAWSFYVTQTPVTPFNVLQGTILSVFTGSYYHFWYIYLLAGLYLITPILRAAVAYKNPRLIEYLIFIWFIGICLVPLLPLFTGYSISGEVFLMGGYTGFFLLGYYFQKRQLRRPLMAAFWILGFALTATSTWVMSFPLAPLNHVYFFFDYVAINVVVMSIALYSFLATYPADWPGTKHHRLQKLVHSISCNTLPIFLFHVIVLETFSRGLLGFTVDLTVFPVLEIPAMAVAVLLLTWGLVVLMKKVPVLKQLIG